MIRDKITMNVKNHIIEIKYKSLDKKLNTVFNFDILKKIEKKLKDKKGKFFINNFETCIDWKVIN